MVRKFNYRLSFRHHGEEVLIKVASWNAKLTGGPWLSQDVIGKPFLAVIDLYISSVR